MPHGWLGWPRTCSWGTAVEALLGKYLWVLDMVVVGLCAALLGLAASGLDGKLKSASHLALGLERGGQKVAQDYTIR